MVLCVPSFWCHLGHAENCDSVTGVLGLLARKVSSSLALENLEGYFFVYCGPFGGRGIVGPLMVLRDLFMYLNK